MTTAVKWQITRNVFINKVTQSWTKQRHSELRTRQRALQMLEPNAIESAIHWSDSDEPNFRSYHSQRQTEHTASGTSIWWCTNICNHYPWLCSQAEHKLNVRECWSAICPRGGTSAGSVTTRQEGRKGGKGRRGRNIRGQRERRKEKNKGGARRR